MNNTALPDTPSALIRLAIRDLQTCIAQGYEVDMSEWVFYKGPEWPCTVCLAGAVMVQSLGVLSPEFERLRNIRSSAIIVPYEVFRMYGQRAQNCLFALNRFRVGEVAGALREMGLSPHEGLRGDINVPQYEDSPNLFIAAMEEMADMLEEHGL